MIIKVSELQDEGLAVQDVGQVPSPYADHSWRLEALSLRLTRDGVEVLVQGEIEAVVPQACGRCLEAFPARVQAHVDLRLAPRPTSATSVELAADDLDTDFYADDQLDLGALIETETTLALPMKPLCREDCRGLCPLCGGNRNLVACACQARPPDPRLAVLRELGARLGR
jgi:uncharacterized protein